VAAGAAMNTGTDIEFVGDHEYLVRITVDDIVTLRVYADPEMVAHIGAAEAHIVAATIAYLTDRQQPDELPTDLDLQDVAAAYDDYVDRLRADLRQVV